MTSRKIMGHGAILAILLVAATVQGTAAADAPPAPDAVATINGVPISRERYDQEVDRASQRFTRQGQPVPEEIAKMIQGRVLDFLIGEELLFQECTKKGVVVSDARVDEEIAKVKTRFGSDEKFKEALAEMKVTEEKVKGDIKRGLTIQEFVQKEVTDKIAVTPEETRAFYDENQKLFTKMEEIHASHILVKVAADADEAAKAEARARIDKAAQRVRDGEDFAAVAKEASECPSGPKGGDLGSFQRGQMVKPFEETAFALDPGKVSDVVETEFGYHIIKVLDKTPQGTATYEEVQAQIADHLEKEKSQAAVQAYIDKLKQSAAIVKNV